MSDSIVAVEVPDGLPGHQHLHRLNRRLSAYLADRAAGLPGLRGAEPSQVTVRPLTEEERAARAARLAAARGTKPERAYTYRRSAVQAYKPKSDFPQHTGGPSNTAEAGPSDRDPEKGEGETVSSPPSGPDESGSQDVAGKPAEAVPSGAPAQSPQAEPAEAAAPSPMPTPAPAPDVMPDRLPGPTQRPRRRAKRTSRGGGSRRAGFDPEDLGPMILKWLGLDSWSVRKPRR